MIVPDPAYRPNPARAIYVQGVIDEQTVARVTPRIIQLQANSRDPITVYIDSRGGNVASAESIIRLLASSNQNSDPPCRIITVVTGRAASAAADLLSSGNYAIAYPEATIFYHGVRQSLPDPVTVEFGSALTESLKISNDRSAMALARRTEWRFMFRFVMMKHQFGDFRARISDPAKSDLDCFVGLVCEHLSSQAMKLVSRARERHGRYSSLLDKALTAAFRSKSLRAPKKSVADVEAEIIKKIIDFEVANHKKEPDWSFHAGGLSRLSDDFFLLNEYVISSGSDQFKRICERWGQFALTPEETAELEAMPDEKVRTEARLNKVRAQFQPLWSFLVALCHALQEGEENYMTALDAFWLGLIDEVIGEDFPSPRLFSEFQPDPAPIA